MDASAVSFSGSHSVVTADVELMVVVDVVEVVTEDELAAPPAPPVPSHPYLLQYVSVNTHPPLDALSANPPAARTTDPTATELRSQALISNLNARR